MIPYYFQYPATEPVSDVSCVQGGAPEQHLAELRLYRDGDSVAYRIKSIVGMEGREDSLHLDPGEWCITLTDVAGNEGCRHCVNAGPLGVPESKMAEDHESRYYDLAGRRVRPPLRSGLYFVRENGTRRVVLIR